MLNEGTGVLGGGRPLARLIDGCSLILFYYSVWAVFRRQKMLNRESRMLILYRASKNASVGL